MKSINKIHVTRIILQILAAIGGLCGILFIYIGIHFIITAISQQEYLFFAIMPVFIATGGGLIYMAYQMIQKFSYFAIKNFCILSALFLFGELSRRFRLFADQSWKNKEQLYYFALAFIPLIIAVIFYKVFLKVLIMLTEEKRQITAPDQTCKRF